LGTKKHKIEFLAYKILFLLFTENQLGITILLPTLTQKQRSKKAIVHALDTWKAVTSRNYYRFHQLHSNAPHMSGYIMDKMVDKIRDLTWETMLGSYQKIPLELACHQLGFVKQERECLQFLQKKDAKLDKKKETILTDLEPFE